MQFKQWFFKEEQSNQSIFMNTDKTGLGPKPSSNAGLPKPSDGWFRGKGQPALWMKKKMKKESCLNEDSFNSYDKVAKEIVYLLDNRKGSKGEGRDRDYVEQETLKLIHKHMNQDSIDWEQLNELAKNFCQKLYNNYSVDEIQTQEAKIDSLLAYLAKYFTLHNSD